MPTEPTSTPNPSPAEPPRRIQRKRTRGWRMPEGTVYVGRPTRFGNPYVVGGSVAILAPVANHNPTTRTVRDRAHALALYRRWLFHQQRAAMVPELRGKDLACWCPLDQPCHADVLLEIANAERPPSPPSAAPTEAPSREEKPE